MGRIMPAAIIGKSRTALFFIFASCCAMGYHFAVNYWFSARSVMHIVLPVAAAALVSFLVSRYSKQQKKMEDIITSQQEQLTSKRAEASQLRTQLVDVERKARTAKRELQRLRKDRCLSDVKAGSKFETTFHATPDPMLLADMESGLVTDVNESFLKLLDFGWQDVYNNAVSTIFQWATEDDARRFAHALMTGKPENNLQTVSEGDSGESSHALVSMRSVSISGRRSVIIAVRDFSDLYAAQNEIRVFSKALEQSPAGTAILSTNGTVEYINTRFTQITGYTADELHGNKVPFLENLSKKETVFTWDMLAMQEEWREDIYTFRKDSTKCCLSASLSPVREHGDVMHYVLVLEDITQKKAQNRRIRHMAMHDGLTNVANRQHFRLQLKHFIELFNRSTIPFALVFIDLNKFKEINDTRGHDFGDEVLKEVARRLKYILREVDVVSRPGGDEFLLLLSDVQSMEDLEGTLERIAYAIAQQMHLSDQSTVHVTGSIGVAICPEHGTDPDELLSKADHAMYASKRTPEEPFIIWDTSVDMTTQPPNRDNGRDIVSKVL